MARNRWRSLARVCLKMRTSLGIIDSVTLHDGVVMSADAYPRDNVANERRHRAVLQGHAHVQLIGR